MIEGPVIALWLDQTIRRDSSGHRSLDDVMFALAGNKPGPRILTDSMLQALRRDRSAADSSAPMLRRGGEHHPTSEEPFGGVRRACNLY